MELSVTPAGSLRLWQASGKAGDGVKNDFEPDMQADQWGVAASATSGVRSNATLDSECCPSNIRCTILPPCSGPHDPEKSGDIVRPVLKTKCYSRCSHQRFQLCDSAYTHFAF